MDKKITRIFFVDSETSLVNQFEDYLLDHPELKMRIIKKRTTKNKFTNQDSKKKWLKTDVFIFAASLPDGSSIELIESLKANESTEHTKIIFLVNRQTVHFVELAKQNNVDRILMKPFNIKALVQAIVQLRES